MSEISDYKRATRNYPEAWVDEELFGSTILPFPEPIILFPKLKTITFSRFKDLKTNTSLVINKDLLDDPSPKFVYKYDHFIGHTILDTWAWLLYVVRVKPELKIVLAIEKATYNQIVNLTEEHPGHRKRRETERVFFEYTTNLLDNLGVDYFIAPIDSKTVYAVSNAFFLQRVPEDIVRSAAVSSMVAYLTDTIPKEIRDKKPDKVVYLSRGKTYHGYSGTSPTDVNSDEISESELRIIDEHLLEEFLESHGVQIVYPEDFSNFQDQLNFMHQVKTMIAPTTSGLNNSLWMQNGGKMLELCTPLYMTKDNFEIHTHYQANAILKEHMFTRVPVTNKKAEAIIQTFKDNPSLLAYIKE